VRSSFEEFLQANADGLARMAYVITWDEREAEDLAQECLLRVAKHWQRISRMDFPAAYARQILMNLATDGRVARRRRLREVTSTFDHEILSFERGAPDAEADAFELLGVRSELMDALGSVPKQQRTVLVLRYYLDLSEAEIAAVLGCSRGTVKSNAARGLDRLRQLLSPPTETKECIE
jgi:RNA polymerase sigma-70 factor (sigma-E family)